MTHPPILPHLYCLLVDLHRHLGRTIAVLDLLRMGVYRLIIYIDTAPPPHN